MKNRKTLAVALASAVILLLCIVNIVAVNPGQLKAREFRISSDRLSDNLKGNVIVFFSDIHFSDVNNSEKLAALKKMISEYDPDLLIFGGDLKDRELDEEEKRLLGDTLNDLSARYGKIAVSGDEDDEEDLEMLKNAGYMIIDNDRINVHFGSSSHIEVINGGGGDPSVFTLSVSHRPDDLSDGDLMIAGHSLGGQFYIPLINYFYRPDGAEKYYHGTYRKNGGTLIVSNGVGGKEKGIRCMADAEITVIRLD